MLNWIDINDRTQGRLACAECKAYVLDTDSYYTISSERSGPHTTYKCYYTHKKKDINEQILIKEFFWRISDAKEGCESHLASNKKDYRDMKIDLILGMVGMS
jgi:hypothetical protein